MSKNPLKLKIAYLYPDILESFCDRANVEAFKYRANLRDVEVNIYEINDYEKISASKYDFYYIGGSNTSSLEVALGHLEKNKDVELLVEQEVTVENQNIPIILSFQAQDTT